MLVDLLPKIQEKIWTYLLLQDLKNISLTCKQQNGVIAPSLFRCVKIPVEGADQLLEESRDNVKLVEKLQLAEQLHIVGDEENMCNEVLRDCVCSFVEGRGIFTTSQSLTLRRLDLNEKQFELLCNGLPAIKKLVLFAIIDETPSPLRYTVHLRKLTSLQTLECAYGDIDDSVMEDIGEVESLVQLRLSRCTRVTDVGLNYLTRCNNLEVLILDFITITAHSLTPLMNLRQLELEDCAIVIGGMASLASLPKLEELSLISCGIDDERFKLITELTSLKKLCIGQYGSTVDDNSLAGIACLVLLEDLRILDGDWLDQDMLMNISKLPRLKRLELHSRTIHELNTSLFSGDVKLVLSN